MSKEQKRRVQIHQSGINMMGFCAAQFEHRYIYGRKRPADFFLIAGTATHNSSSADLRSKVSKGELLPEDEVLDRARDSVQRGVDSAGGLSQVLLSKDEEPVGPAGALGAAKDKAARLARLHHRELAPLIRPAPWTDAEGNVGSVERKFSIDLDAFLRDRAREMHKAARLAENGTYERKMLDSKAASLNVAARGGLDFSGEVDVNEEFELGVGAVPDYKVLSVRDLKTKGKSPAATEADDSDQLSGYALVSKVLDGRLPDYVALDCLVDLKSGPKKAVLASVRTEHDVDVFLNRLLATVHAIRTGVFTPIPSTDWRCTERWCGYFGICQYARRPRTVAVPQQIVQIAGVGEESKGGI